MVVALLAQLLEPRPEEPLTEGETAEPPRHQGDTRPGAAAVGDVADGQALGVEGSRASDGTCHGRAVSSPPTTDGAEPLSALQLQHPTRLRIRRADRHSRPGRFQAQAAIGVMIAWVAGCESPPLTGLFHQEQRCTVQSIPDGDTLRLICRGEPLEVRLHCIDAPELEQKPWGQRSREHLRTLTPKRVLLIAYERDRYGRTVGELLTDSPDRESLNLAQVRTGNAAVYRSFCEKPAYYQAEREAKRLQVGIWARGGAHQQPWEYRRR